MTSVAELESKIAAYAQQVASSSSELSARAKKRVYQKLGKLKKQLVAAQANGGVVLSDGEGSDNDDNEGKEEKTKQTKAKRAREEDKPSTAAPPLHEKSEQNKKKAKISTAATTTTAIAAATTANATENAAQPPQKTEQKKNNKKDKSADTQTQTERESETGAKKEDDSSSPTEVVTEAEKAPKLSKKETKAVLHSLHQELVDCAVKKQLARAKKAFRQSEKRGLSPDVLAYTNFINVFVRCNDPDGAVAILEEMRARYVEPNTVTFTTLLKGFCEIGKMSAAAELFFEQMIPSAQWNLRSLSTFLRGCTRIGAVDLALRAFNACYQTEAPQNAGDEASDESACLEAMVGLLARANRLQEATTLVTDYVTGKLRRRDSEGDDQQMKRVLQNAALYTILAKSSALLGLFTDARKYMQIATKLIEEGDQATLKENMRRRFQENVEQNGGKLPGEAQSAATSATSKSVELFMAHKRNDLRSQTEMIEEYIAAMQTIASKPAASCSAALGAALSAQDHTVIEACRVNALALSQLLYFGFDGHSDLSESSTETKELRQSLLTALREKYGLDRLDPLSLSPSFSAVPDKHVAEAKELIERRVSAMREETVRRVNSTLSAETGKVDFKKLFPDCELAKVAPAKVDDNEKKFTEEEKKKKMELRKKQEMFKRRKGGKPAPVAPTPTMDVRATSHMTGTLPKEYLKLLNPNAEDSENDSADEGESEDESDNEEQKEKERAIPIKLEIGSGNGDWIVAQAAADRVVTVNHSNSAEKTVTVKGNWVACELRNDRAHHIWSNQFFSARHLLSSALSADDNASAALKGGNNLAVLAGDASKILKQHIDHETVSEIFINYPQPPERVAGDHKNQGKHLLTHDFFSDMMRILKMKGTITILTDNLSYAQSLAQTVATINKTALNSRKKTPTGESKVTALMSVELEESDIERRVIQEHVPFKNDESKAKKKKSDEDNEHDFKDSVVIWRGDPGDDAGHVAMVSSYFDRMWSLGQKKRRWFIFLRKKLI